MFSLPFVCLFVNTCVVFRHIPRHIIGEPGLTPCSYGFLFQLLQSQVT